MFDFIPVNQYTQIYDYMILILVIIAFWQCNMGTIFNKNVKSLNEVWGTIFTFFLILYIGLRPISVEFGDTVNYAKGFYEVQASHEPFKWTNSGDWLFYNIHHLFAKYSDIHSFFLFCSIVYVGCIWLAMRRIFGSFYYIPLLVVFSMFFFWSYGVNGIRNGMGASVIILAMTYVGNPRIMMLLAFIAVGLHKSTLLMVGSCAIAWYFKSSRSYLITWILCIVISLIAGNRLQGWLAGINILGDDERFSGYLTGENMVGELVQMSMVFRWDFLLYSSIGVVVGYYFIFQRDFKDEYYQWIFNSFLLMNSCWILIIRAAYSNRFAQISWFIMPLILIYPFLRERFWRYHERYLGIAILLFYSFAFYYNIYANR